MRRRSSAKTIASAIALMTAVAGGPLGAETRTCDGVAVTVTAPEAAQVGQACAAAERAMPVLAACDAAPERPMRIDLVDDLGPGCMGVFHCGTDLIEVLTPDAVARERRAESAFAGVPTEGYFASIVAHELAHAAYDKVPCPFLDCLVTSEYVAYAMQVRALSEADRAAFEAGYASDDRVSMEEPVSREAISGIGLLMAPDRFARRVWAHYSQRPDGCAYVAAMMAGEFHLDSERP